MARFPRETFELYEMDDFVSEILGARYRTADIPRPIVTPDEVKAAVRYVLVFVAILLALLLVPHFRSPMFWYAVSMVCFFSLPRPPDPGRRSAPAVRRLYSSCR